MANIINDYKEEFKTKSDILELLHSCVNEYATTKVSQNKLALFNACKKIASFDSRFQEFYRLYLLSQK
ncbi:TPA: hypothetical protein DEG21_01300 [Patescibacteria group bacterium]|nr:hypothetical protein [Candidatus Gracilibacteria bacterium]HBY74534.1 hypothetical protein [Candidatus Gracilibacteria bacterium]